MRYMMVISYDGSKFYGFQRQNNVRNVQGYLENALSNFWHEEIKIKGAGRTDRGVHARYQVIHFDTLKRIDGLKKYLNNNLEDIRVKKIKRVADSFHARMSVQEKTYLYKIDLSGKRSELYYKREKNKLNIGEMKRTSNLFLGTHDFHNFVAGERIDYHSTIKKIKIFKIGSILYLKFVGIGFYRYMVRNLVGALLEVGKGKTTYETIKKMLDYPNQEKRLNTSSPNGLYLIKIKY